MSLFGSAQYGSYLTSSGGNLGIINAGGSPFAMSGSTTGSTLQLIKNSGQTAGILLLEDTNGAPLAQFDNNANFQGYGENFTLDNLGVPTQTTTSSGTSYYYEITATNGQGETIASSSIG